MLLPLLQLLKNDPSCMPCIPCTTILVEKPAGRKARQLSSMDPNTGMPRLAWCHTICGFFLATRDLLYATTRGGVTHEGNESDREDDRSYNSDLEDENAKMMMGRRRMTLEDLLPCIILYGSSVLKYVLGVTHEGNES